MGRRIGGLRMLPPFGLPEYHRGDYTGTIEALNAVSTYVRELRAKYIVMVQGNVAANLDLKAAMRHHVKSGAEITAICTERTPEYRHHRYVVDADGFARRMIFNQTTGGEGLASLEAYIISKELLITMMDACAAVNHYHFHRDAIAAYLENGGKVNVYLHPGYARRIMSLDTYLMRAWICSSPSAVPKCSRQSGRAHQEPRGCQYLLRRGGVCHKQSRFRRLHHRGRSENCVLSSDVRIAPGAKIENCILMRGAKIGEGVILNSVIADKYASVSAFRTLMGSEKLPIVIPKNSNI